MYVADITAPHFRFELISPEKMERAGMEQAVTLPATQGQMTVLANHTPLVVELQAGIVALSRPAGQPPEEYFIAGGFADISNEHCVILTPEATPLVNLTRRGLEEKIARLHVDLQAETDIAKRSRLEQQLVLLDMQLTVAKS